MRLNRLVAGGSLHDPTVRAFAQPRPMWQRALGALFQLIGLGVAVGIIAYAFMAAG